MTAAGAKARSMAARVETPLLRLVERLGAKPTRLARQRRLLPVSPEVRLRLILREIDETILPRDLALIADGRRVAGLAVSHRHLIGLDLAERQMYVAGEDVTAEDFAPGLQALAELPYDLELHAARRGAGHEPVHGGCSARTLEHVLGLLPLPEGFEGLRQRLAARALATLEWAAPGGAGAFLGDMAWQDMLRKARQDHPGHAKAALPAPRFGAPRIEGLAWPVSPLEMLILSVYGDRGIAAILPQTEGLLAIADWQVLSG